MAKAWKEVIASSAYQALPQEQKIAAQEQYFNEVVAPKAGDDVAQAKQQFYVAYPVNGSELSAAQMANLDIPTDEIMAYHDKHKPQQSPQVKDPFTEAGKGLLQTGVNAANIIPEIADAFMSGASWAGNQLGIEDGTYTPTQRLELPDNLKPQDPYAKLGAEIGPYLIPGVGAGRTAAALGSVANAGRLERGATKLADMVAENAVGALAQNSQRDNGQSLATDLGVGVTGSGLARAITPILGKAYNAVVQRGNQSLGNDTVRSVGKETGQLSTEESLRKMASQSNPDLASSLEGLNVNPKADVIASADRLGLTEDLLPSHLSGNQQYQAVEQAIKSRTGSILKVQEDNAILKLSESAGKLIDEVANVPDALSLNQKVIGQFDNRMNALERKSDQLYQRVDKAMPPSTIVEANNTSTMLERKADELGGWENLDTIEKKVFKAVNPGKEGILTYANLNKQRRLVGQALFKNKGPYKDADEAALSYLYRQLSKDQRVVLGDVGARRDFEVAQRLVQMRKNMEDQMVNLRSKNLTGDIANKGSLAVASLAKGNSRQFTELMRNLPSREMKQEVAGASIRDMLSAGKRGADFNPAGFADWYQNLRHSGNIKILSNYMPKNFMKGLHDTYVVADAIRRAKSFELTTGKLNDFARRFDAVTKPYELTAKYASKAGTMAGTKFGPLGAIAGGSIGEKLAAKARSLGGGNSSEAAEKLISSPEFQQAAKGITQSVSKSGSSTRKMFDETKLRTSQVWRNFYNTLSENDKRLIARMGFVWWVNKEEGQ